MKFKLLNLLVLVLSATSIYGADFWQGTIGPYGGSITCIEMDSTGRIYAGGNGLFVSTDNGESWDRIHIYEKLRYQGHLSIRNIYVLDSMIYVSGDKGGSDVSDPFSICSSDKGITWIDYDRTFEHITISKNRTYYAEDNYYSMDGGKTWDTIIHDSQKHQIEASIFDNDDIFFMSKWDGYVYRSTDYGKSWTETGNDTIMANTFAIGKKGELFAGTVNGVYCTTDKGVSWIHKGLDSLSIKKLIVTNFGNLLALVTPNLIFQSNDNGTSWHQTGPNEIYHGTIANIKNHKLLLGFYQSGIFSSSDEGLTWNESGHGLDNVAVNHFLLDNENRIMVGTGNRGVMVTNDGGKNWIERNNNLCQDCQKIDVLIRNSKGELFTVTYKNLYASSDNGNAWNIKCSDLQYWWDVIFKVNIKDELFYASSDFGKLYRSSNNGSIWDSISLTVDYLVLDFIFDRNDEIYASIGYLIHSTDNGNNWDTIKVGTGVNRILFDNDENIIVNSFKGLLKSIDKGGSWLKICSDTIYGQPIFIDKTGQIIVITKYGIKMSRNQGQTWDLIDTTLKYLNVYNFAQDEDGFLYASTERGIYKSLETIVSVKEPSQYLIQSNQLNIYPNPANDKANIQYSILSNEFIKISIFNSYGAEIQVLVNQFQDSGQKIIKFDTNGLPAGLYFVKLQAGERTYVEKMIILK